ncbi:MAG: hypothetical protein D6798_11080, partial [Deltaproteobacteria bacterium]
LTTACPAEMMGVELVRGGPEAISVEDLQRDTWALTRAPAGGAAAVLARRLGEMRVLPAAGRAWIQGSGPAERICGRKDGRESEAVLVVAGGGAQSPLSWAALISLAKGFDTPTPPPRTLLFCAVGDDAGAAALLAAPPVPVDRLAAVWRIGGIREGRLVVSRLPGPFQSSAELAEAWTSGAPPAGAEPVDPGAVDYRILADQLRELVGQIAADPPTQP